MGCVDFEQGWRLKSWCLIKHSFLFVMEVPNFSALRSTARFTPNWLHKRQRAESQPFCHCLCLGLRPGFAARKTSLGIPNRSSWTMVQVVKPLQNPLLVLVPCSGPITAMGQHPDHRCWCSSKLLLGKLLNLLIDHSSKEFALQSKCLCTSDPKYERLYIGTSHLK